MAVTAAVGVLPFRIAAISEVAFPIAGDGVLRKAAPNGVICAVKSFHTTAADDPVAQLILLYFFAHLDNGAKIRAGVGRSRREAGERAQLVDSLQSTAPLSLVVFELANGLYAYNIPTEFTRTFTIIVALVYAGMFVIFHVIF